MKKIMMALLSLALIVVGGLFVACEPEHTCAYDFVGKDATNHWMQCECGAIDETTVVAHAPASDEYTLDDDAHWFTCSCGEVLGCTDHATGTAYFNNEVAHWHACDCGKIDPSTIAPHELGDYVADANNHWKVCSICEGIVGVEAHTGIEDFKCDTCATVLETLAGTDLKTLAQTSVTIADAVEGVEAHTFTGYTVTELGTYHVANYDATVAEAAPVGIVFKGFEKGLYKATLGYRVNGGLVEAAGVTSKVNLQCNRLFANNTAVQEKNYAWGYSGSRISGATVEFLVYSDEYCIDLAFVAGVTYDVVVTFTKVEEADLGATEITTLNTVAATAINGYTDAVDTYENFYEITSAGTYSLRYATEYEYVGTGYVATFQSKGIVLKGFAAGNYKVAVTSYKCGTTAYSHSVTLDVLGTGFDASGAWVNGGLKYAWHNAAQYHNVTGFDAKGMAGRPFTIELTGDDLYLELGGVGKTNFWMTDVVFTITADESEPATDVTTLQRRKPRNNYMGIDDAYVVTTEGRYYIGTLATNPIEYPNYIFALPQGKYQIKISYGFNNHGINDWAGTGFTFDLCGYEYWAEDGDPSEDWAWLNANGDRVDLGALNYGGPACPRYTWMEVVDGTSDEMVFEINAEYPELCVAIYGSNTAAFMSDVILEIVKIA